MRQTIFRAALLCALLWAGAQISAQEPLAPRLVDKEYRNEYRAGLKEAERTVKQLREEGWDIVLDVPQRVPTALFSGVEAIDHWGKGILLPAGLVERLRAECVYPVVGKISDTGVDTKHPELAGNWWLTSSDYTGDPGALHLHGTHVAGIAFSLLEPLIKNQKVILKSCRNLNSQGAGNFSWAANMLATERTQDKDFIDKGAAVLYNFSWGGMRGIEPTMEEELKKSADLGVLYVGAAGNNGGEYNSYPAMSAYVVACASLDQSLVRSTYSNLGPYVDNAMPGRSINSTVPGGGFATLSGTSMASPMLFAASVIAKSKWGAKIKTTADLHKYLAGVATDLTPEGWDNATGWGIVYFYSILDTDPATILDPGNPPPPPPPVDVNVVTSNFGGFSIRWQYNGKRDWNVLHIDHLRLDIGGEASGEALFDRLDQWLPTFFTNRGILLPEEMDGHDAAYWTGRFLELVAKDEGLTVGVVELVAVDERGRRFYVTGFERAGGSNYAPGVRLVPIE